MRERFFCAAQSRANDEPVFGTVAHIRSWVLLEYPSVWRHDAIEDSRLLAAPVRSRLLGMGDRALLIRHDHHRRERLECFFVQSSDPVRMTRALLRDYDELAGLSSSAGDAVGGVTFAVCTHGRHDRCCAKFGIPLSCAFRDLVGERAWQCSHVGGDRFAGNVVVFPYGVYYGRATPEDVPEIVRRSDAGEVWMPGYRGRSCHPRAVQVADYFARRESGRLRIDEFRPVDRVTIEPGVTRVRLAARSDATVHRVEFRTAVSLLRQRLTCEAEEESTRPQYELVRYSVD
jgi:hypothetical protein